MQKIEFYRQCLVLKKETSLFFAIFANQIKEEL